MQISKTKCYFKICKTFNRCLTRSTILCVMHAHMFMCAMAAEAKGQSGGPSPIALYFITLNYVWVCECVSVEATGQLHTSLASKPASPRALPQFWDDRHSVTMPNFLYWCWGSKHRSLCLCGKYFSE